MLPVSPNSINRRATDHVLTISFQQFERTSNPTPLPEFVLTVADGSRDGTNRAVRKEAFPGVRCLCIVCGRHSWRDFVACVDVGGRVPRFCGMRFQCDQPCPSSSRAFKNVSIKCLRNVSSLFTIRCCDAKKVNERQFFFKLIPQISLTFLQQGQKCKRN